MSTLKKELKVSGTSVYLTVVEWLAISYCHGNIFQKLRYTGSKAGIEMFFNLKVENGNALYSEKHISDDGH